MALFFVPLPAISQTTTADETEIVPMLECVSISPKTGNYIAVFGYNNPSKTEVSVPPESSSLSCAGALVSGNNINVFKPGRVFSAFTVEYECAELTWTVTGPSGKPRSVTANASATLCATTGTIIPNVTTTTTTPGKTFGKIGSELSILAAGGNIPTDYVYQIEVIGGVRYVFVTLIAVEGRAAALLSDVNGLGLLEANVAGVQITGWFLVSKLLDLNSLSNLRLALPGFTPIRNGGAVTSQGDLAQRTDLTRAGFSVQGEGIKIGVLSDSYNARLGNEALLDVQQGDLPGVENPLNPTPVQVLRDLPSGSGLGTDEGRAMLQIIHDVAPKATLAFRTAFNGHLDMAEGIREFKNAGCNIIVDDITYITEPFFQDGVVAQAVDAVAAQGVTYFSAAGNFGVRSYQGQFNPLNLADGRRAHNFSGGDYLQRLYLSEGSYTLAMQWVSNSGQDIDFYLTTETGEIIIGYNRDGTYPFESMAFHVSAGGAVANIMVVNASTTVDPDITFKYIIFRGNAGIAEHQNGTSTITGQANAAGAIAVGAVLYSNTPRYHVNPPTIASFSSRGGTPILRDAANSAVNITRQKPDFTAPNGVNTTVPLGGVNIDGDGFPNFFGTSASAPHAAAAAALILEAHKKYSSSTLLDPVTVRSLMRTSALNMGEAGWDNVSGYGFIRPDAAISTFATPTPIAESLIVSGAIAAGSTVKVKGHYFKNSPGGSISQITFDGVAVATTFISETELQAVIPAFTGNPAIRVCSPSSSILGGDGGCSKALYLFPKTVITIKANNSIKRYGDSMPAFTATITNAPASLLPGDIRFTTLATDISDVGAYVVTPSIRTGHPLLALSDDYEFVYEPGILQIEKIAVEIVPNDLAISEGDPIQGFTYTYNFPVPIANSSDRIQLIRNKLSEAHKALRTNRVALVTESHLLQLASIRNKSFLISEAAEANAAFVYNSSFVINVSSSVLNELATTEVNASSVINATWVMNASFVINSLRVYNSSFVINASSVMNTNTIGVGNNEEAILILNKADEVLSRVYAINLITGYSVGTHLWSPATLLSNNYNVSYGEPAIFSVNPKGTGVKAVKPYLECVEATMDGRFIAHFWYENPNAVAVCLPLGPDNKLVYAGSAPITVNGTCIPKVFKPGKHYAFSIAFDGNKCYWSLTSNQGTKKTSIASEASSGSSRCKTNARGSGNLCTDGVLLSSVTTSSLQRSSLLDDKEIAVYPNPVEDILKIDLQRLGDTEVVITLYDALGRVCLKDKLNSKKAMNDIKVSNLKPGLYLLKMEYGDVSKHIRIIKQ